MSILLWTRIFLLVLIQACSSFKVSGDGPSEQKKQVSVWDIIEKCMRGDCSKNSIVQILGNPKITTPDRKNPEREILIYYSTVDDLQEWAFTFDKSNRFISLIYLPSSMTRQEITLNEIKSRWRHLGCSAQEKTENMADTITTKTSLICDHNRRIIEYNRYGEVSAIGILN